LDVNKCQLLVLFIYSIQLKFTSYTRITTYSFFKIHGLIDFDAVMKCTNFTSIKIEMKPGKCTGLLQQIYL